MSLEVEWDPATAEWNLRKHGVSFAEAATVLGDPLSIALDDPDHTESESRLLLLGRAANGRSLVVAITERGDTVRNAAMFPDSESVNEALRALGEVIRKQKRRSALRIRSFVERCRARRGDDLRSFSDPPPKPIDLHRWSHVLRARILTRRCT